MITEKRKTGDLGENIAALWLQKKGFRIVTRNYWKKWGEIDIVATKGKVVHFVEVKSVKRFVGEQASRDQYEAEENVHYHKLKRLYVVIDMYLEDTRVPDDTDWQLDVVVVELDDEKREGRVRMLEDVG